jgi:hypothetical protein
MIVQLENAAGKVLERWQLRSRVNRLGSSADAELRYDDLPIHAATVVEERGELTVFNRSGAPLKIDRKPWDGLSGRRWRPGEVMWIGSEHRLTIAASPHKLVNRYSICLMLCLLTLMVGVLWANSSRKPAVPDSDIIVELNNLEDQAAELAKLRTQLQSARILELRGESNRALQGYQRALNLAMDKKKWVGCTDTSQQQRTVAFIKRRIEQL